MVVHAKLVGNNLVEFRFEGAEEGDTYVIADALAPDFAEGLKAQGYRVIWTFSPEAREALLDRLLPDDRNSNPEAR